MRWLTLLVLFLATVTIYGDDEVATEQEIEEEEEADWQDDGVLTLTSDNFESYIKENEFVLVEFYAPWCEHCKSFSPEYAKVAKHMEEEWSTTRVVKVDASNDTKFGEAYGIKGYPTLKFFRSGSPSDYWGAKQADTIVDWLKKKTGPLAVEIENIEGAEEFVKSQPVVVIGFFKDRESDEVKEFLSAADAVDDYRFGITSNQDVFAKYEAKSDSIILFQNSQDGKSVFEGELSKTEILEFVAVQSAPLVIDFNRSFTHVVFGVLKKHLLMFISKKAGHMEKYVQPAEELAKQFRGKVLFVAINSDDADYERILSYFNVKTEDIPTMRLIHTVDDTSNKYKPKNADLSLENIRSFVQDGIDGKLKQDLLTQDLPEDWDKTPVKTLVSTNFDEVVLNTEKDVFVAFYAPWSEDSKELAPVFDELGEEYKDSETVVIAKFDASANELDPKHPKIISYPTSKLYKKGDNSISYYTGKKTLDAFVKFIESGGEEIEYEDDEDEDEEVTEESEHDEL